jgi:hypothetical protein
MRMAKIFPISVYRPRHERRWVSGLVLSALLAQACGSESANPPAHEQGDGDSSAQVGDDDPGDGDTGDGDAPHTGDGDGPRTGDGDVGDGDNGEHPDQPTGDGDDDAPGDGDGEVDDSQDGVIEALGSPCHTQLARACAEHNSATKLVCLDGTWAYDGSCDGNSRCDTREGPTLGTCQGIALECLNREPDQVFCSDDKHTVLHCGDDRITVSRHDCDAKMHCENTGHEGVCQCDVPDGLGGCAVEIGRYWDNQNGTVYDPKTRLTWQRAFVNKVHLAGAQTGCALLTLENPRSTSGWRMPTAEELETLVDASQGTPAIDHTAFPDTPTDTEFLTTTRSPAGLEVIVAVSFADGGEVAVGDGWPYYAARCVSE